MRLISINRLTALIYFINQFNKIINKYILINVLMKFNKKFLLCIVLKAKQKNGASVIVPDYLILTETSLSYISSVSRFGCSHPWYTRGYMYQI